MTQLAFYDARRMYWPSMEEREHEFEIGGFSIATDFLGRLDLTGDDRGSFTIMLHDFTGVDGLSPQLRVHHDAFGALHTFAQMGGLAALEVTGELPSADYLTKLLLACGLTDVSRELVPEARAA